MIFHENLAADLAIISCIRTVGPGSWINFIMRPIRFGIILIAIKYTYCCRRNRYNTFWLVMCQFFGRSWVTNALRRKVGNFYYHLLLWGLKSSSANLVHFYKTTANSSHNTKTMAAIAIITSCSIERCNSCDYRKEVVDCIRKKLAA
jgi:hypothetical protein